MNTEMPKIIYGTAWKKEKTAAFVVQAVEAGFRAIDTACQPKHYFERGVGDALAILKTKGFKRSDIFLQTKFTPLAGQDPNAIPYDKNASLKTQVAESFEVSKKNLQTDYVDALVLHSPLFPFAKLLEVWRAMELLYKNAEALQLGISNCYDLALLQRLYEEAQIKPSIVQNRFYADTGYDKELRKWCREKNIRTQSFWTLSANPHLLASKTIVKIALKYKKSEAQILFNYLYTQGVTPLSGTTSAEHMQEDLQAFDFVMSDDEKRSISELL
ncbi:MAG: aldo/keto reductase [Sulfurimonas sp.]|nr:aldo/keto reductase [Sulfurimonas sp.]MDD5203233.1 aldo/keto reductase [Sulfurimonas sp.]